MTNPTQAERDRINEEFLEELFAEDEEVEGDIYLSDDGISIEDIEFLCNIDITDYRRDHEV